MDETFSWTVDGKTYDCERETRACPFCFVVGAIVELPPPLLAKQPDDTTHVCAPFFGGCNQGFAKDKAA